MACPTATFESGTRGNSTGCPPTTVVVCLGASATGLTPTLLAVSGVSKVWVAPIDQQGRMLFLVEQNRDQDVIAHGLEGHRTRVAPRH